MRTEQATADTTTMHMKHSDLGLGVAVMDKAIYFAA